MDDVSLGDVSVGGTGPPGPDAPRLQRVPRKALRRPRPEIRLSLRPGRPLATAVLAVVAVALAVTTGLLANALRDTTGADGQRTAALAAARQEAAALTTLSSQTGARDFATVLAGAGGSLKQQLAQGRAGFLKTLSNSHVNSVGTVLDAGIVTMNSGTATVLIDVRATVSNKQTAKPEKRVYHWQASLVHSGGRWLVTSLEFV